MTGWPVLALGVASVLAGYFYTASPFSLAYRGLGEVVVFVFMGPVIVMGAYYVQVEHFAWEAFIASVPIGLLVAAILHANNVRDIENDRRNNKWTLAALAGRPLADYEFIALTLGAYVVGRGDDRHADRSVAGAHHAAHAAARHSAWCASR